MTFGNQIGCWPQHTDCSQLFRLVNPIKRFTFIQIQQLSIAEMCQKRLLSTSKSIKTINLLVLINDWNNIDRPFNYHDNRAYEAKLLYHFPFYCIFSMKIEQIPCESGSITSYLWTLHVWYSYRYVSSACATLNNRSNDLYRFMCGKRCQNWWYSLFTYSVFVAKKYLYHVKMIHMRIE